jgi:predicted PurR-regulated permease PerM
MTREQDGWMTRWNVLGLLLLAITGALIILCTGMMVPFLPGLSWGLALAIITRPVHRCYCRVLGDNGKAAFAMALLVGLFLLLPTYFVVDRVLHEVAQAARFVTDPQEIKNFEQKIRQYPQFATVMNWVGGHLNLKVYAQKLLEKIAPNPTGIVWGGMWLFGQTALTLITLFYLLRDRHQWSAALRQLMPLSIEESEEIFARAQSSVHATIFGSVLMAALQGFLGGVAFFAAGLPAPLLWGVVMGFMALIPSLGTWVVWWPAVFYLLATGSTSSAIALATWCFWVVGSIDNILYPVVVGREISLHPLLVLLFIIGGMFTFGAAGLVLGPLVLSLMDALIEIWRRRTAFGHTAEAGVQG